jgi:predicted ATP-grasp superfamily ATP-dependent carboligase
MNATDTILELAKTTDDGLVRSPDWYRQLVDAVNDLVVNDFSALIQILYRLDVSETKIRTALAANPVTDAAELIAKLLLERQLQKLEMRKHFSSVNPVDEDEKW